MKTTLLRTAALCALVMPAIAHAQSTGSVDFEETIVVTGTRTKQVGGVQAPETTKAKQVLTQEMIERQNPGQTILDTVNLIPGVNFQNNDAYGSAGGTLNIRGFSSDRVSLTFDGVPLNDSGNYAIYSNQQLDPEIIEQVNVNLGSTDVDSPTAAASGSTVNYRSKTPDRNFGGTLSASVGEFDFFRVFGKLETGEITSFGTRAFFSASRATNRVPFNSYGRIRKQQYNARIYQPIGDNGDFVSLAGHYNENRNNFFGSVALREDRTPQEGGFSFDKDLRFIDVAPCNLVKPARDSMTVTVRDVVDSRYADPDAPSSCGTAFDRRYNPSNTGNVRIASRLTIADGLTLSIDPSFQYVKANGGGTVTAYEHGFQATRNITVDDKSVRIAADSPLNGTLGYIGGAPYFGRDLNGDGDALDRVTLLAPSQTRTDRWGVISSLRWDINTDHSVRIAYTLDHARHRQTGEVGGLYQNGEPIDVFPANDPMKDANGNVLQKRDRRSLAILNQIAGEYRGEFGNLIVNAGIRAPFFKRDLNNYCFTTVGGNVDCFGSNTAGAAAYAAANPAIQGPQRRVFNYNRVLPNIGLIYNFTPQVSSFFNYSKGLQVPGTDNLYNSFFFALATEQAKPKPETSDNFDLGLRYRSSKIQAQLTGWMTKYNNRLAGAYDPELDRNIYRNLGKVNKYGLDGYVAYQPVRELMFYVFGSVLESDIKDDIQIGVINGQPFYAPTKGKKESGAAAYSFGGRIQGTLGPLELGVQAKRTGPRYIYDTNEPVLTGTPVTPLTPNGTSTLLFAAKTPAYTLVNLDARLSLKDYGLDKTFLQFNVYNLFDQVYVGGFGGGLNQNISNLGTARASYAGPGFVQVGAPRTLSGTLVVGF